MGADLYINRLYKPLREASQPKFDAAVAQRDSATTDEEKKAAQNLVDDAYEQMYSDQAYFRDSYNGTSVLHRVGLSWWRDLEPDIDSDSDPDGSNLSAAACLSFANRLRDAGPPEPITRQYLEANHCTVDGDKNSPEAWNRYFQEKYERLIDFFERGAANGGIYASC